MSQILITLSTWLHALATVVFIGYYLFTSLIYLPVFKRHMQTNALRDLLEQISARLRPFSAARCSFSWSPAPTSC